MNYFILIAVLLTACFTAAQPVILTQPQPKTIDIGGSAVLTTDASGTGLTYQWYAGNSGDLTFPISDRAFGLRRHWTGAAWRMSWMALAGWRW